MDKGTRCLFHWELRAHLLPAHCHFGFTTTLVLTARADPLLPLACLGLFACDWHREEPVQLKLGAEGGSTTALGRALEEVVEVPG